MNIHHISLHVSSFIDPGHLYLPSQQHCSPTLASGCSYSFDDGCASSVSVCTNWTDRNQYCRLIRLIPVEANAFAKKCPSPLHNVSPRVLHNEEFSLVALYRMVCADFKLKGNLTGLLM